ncbi:hypothetical protein RCH16_003164 [Cryobacterium sp. MP_M5]|nr:hypothetical protein [Cryobacterium sp. MP_M5]
MTRSAAPKAEHRAKAPSSPVSPIHRVEGAAVAASAATLFILGGFSWWWLPVLFLVFDLSFIGYAVSNRAGAYGYNLVHNYVAPAILIAVYSLLHVIGIPLWPLAFIAGCWFFHVGADRAMGYGPRPPN